MAVQREYLGAKPAKPSPWNDPRVRAIVYQALTLLGVALLVAYLAHNTITNLQRQGIASGFGFLHKPAGFAIPQTLIPYSQLSPNSQVFWVGLLNTLLVAGVGIVLATLIGFASGSRGSRPTGWSPVSPPSTSRPSATCRSCCRSCSGTLRSSRPCRSRRTASRFLGLFFLNNRGLYTPEPVFETGSGWVGLAVLVAIVAATAVAHVARRRREADRASRSRRSRWGSRC